MLLLWQFVTGHTILSQLQRAVNVTLNIRATLIHILLSPWIPASTRRLLAPRLRRWPNINPALVQRYVFAGMWTCIMPVCHTALPVGCRVNQSVHWMINRRAKPKGSNCLLFKWAVTAFLLWVADTGACLLHNIMSSVLPWMQERSSWSRFLQLIGIEA